jgi:hypothetical protein
MWVNVGRCSKLVLVVSLGKDIIIAIVYLYVFLLRYITLNLGKTC